MFYEFNFARCLTVFIVTFGLLLTVVSLVANAQPAPATLVGNTPIEFRVTYGGAASFKVPLVVPTGAAGLKPSISLNYNSQFANGAMGLGWQLASGLARIEQCYQRNTHQKILCLNGDELRSQGNGFYRTDIDSGILVETISSTEFRLHFDNGDTKTLSRFLSSPNIFLETRHTQRGGASYSVNWSVNSSHREPLVSSIAYQGNEIEFVYTNRPDVRSGYWMGAPRNRTRRLQSVIARADGELYRQYDVFYASDSVSGVSKVTHIQECGSTGECLQPLAFTWTSSGAMGFGSQQRTPHVVRALIDRDNNGYAEYVRSLSENEIYGDFNGDGRKTEYNFDLRTNDD